MSSDKRKPAIGEKVMTTYTKEEWMEICRGKPAYKVAQVLNRYCPGIDWTASSKTAMSKAWWDYTGSYRITNRAELVAAIKQIPPAPSAAEIRARKDRKEFQLRVNRARNYLTYGETGTVAYRATSLATKDATVLSAVRELLYAQHKVMKEKLDRLTASIRQYEEYETEINEALSHRKGNTDR